MTSPSLLLSLNLPISVTHPSIHGTPLNCLHSHLSSCPSTHIFYPGHGNLLHLKPVKSEPAVHVFEKSSQSKSTSTNEHLIITENTPESQFSATSNIKNDHINEPRGSLLHHLSLIHDSDHFTRKGKINLGKGYHGLIIKVGLILDKFVVTGLLNMYAKCGDMDAACKLLHGSLDLDIVMYNSVISGYAQSGLLGEALNVFVQAQDAGVLPNGYTLSILVSICGTVLAVKEGKQLHARIVKMDYVDNTVVGNALLTMYSKFGKMEEVETLFDELPDKNHVSWTAIITALYHQECFGAALERFSCMRQSGIVPNEHTYAVAFASCRGMECPDVGRTYHAHSIKNGMNLGGFVGTAVVDMYSGFGEMRDAEKQIEEMDAMASVVSWNALLAGYIRNDKSGEAMEAFYKMVTREIVCDHFTYSNILNGCSSIPSLASGQQLHAQVIKRDYVSNMHVGSSLIEMYANCGCLAEAEFIFREMPIRDTVSWNSIIKAFSLHGLPKKALDLFREMIKEGTKPSSATFLAILSSCSHTGLVQEGRKLFESMVRDFKISPEEKHYSCIVDLLGRAGELEEARDFIVNLPIALSASIWRPLLAACRYHNELQMAEFVAARILDTEPSDPTVYVTLSNMYAKVGRWDDVDKQRKTMELIEAKKEPGCSWLEVDNKLYTFYSRDTTKTETTKIYEMLGALVTEMKYYGYVPDTEVVMNLV